MYEDIVTNTKSKYYTSDEYLDSLRLTSTINKIKSPYILNNINSSFLGEYIQFNDEEFIHFKDKCMIYPDKLCRDFVAWDWSDEHLEDYIVTIKKRQYINNMNIYEVVQTGDAEITNRFNKHQGSDRDVYSIPFTTYSFDFVFNFLKDLRIFE